MSEDKPKVVNLWSRDEYKDPGERVQPAVNGVDELSLKTANTVTRIIRDGEGHGLVAAMIDPKTGYPIVFTQFPPDTLPRRAALEMIGVLDSVRQCLQDVVEHGTDGLVSIEIDDEDDPA